MFFLTGLPFFPALLPPCCYNHQKFLKHLWMRFCMIHWNLLRHPCCLMRGQWLGLTLWLCLLCTLTSNFFARTIGRSRGIRYNLYPTLKLLSDQHVLSNFGSVTYLLGFDVRRKQCLVRIGVHTFFIYWLWFAWPKLTFCNIERALVGKCNHRERGKR